MYKLVEMYKNRITLKTCIGTKYTYIHTINSEGKSVIFEENKAIITDGKQFKMNCHIVGNLYVAFFAVPVKSSVFKATTSESLWNKRLGDVNNRSLKAMNLPCSEEVCSICKEGKAKRLPFKDVQLPISRRKGELFAHRFIKSRREVFPNNNR
jgi:hypothetical protein